MQDPFEGIVDYAGLFPPASCTMDEAVARYAAYRAGPQRTMLSRFVLAERRLVELTNSISQQGFETENDPWPLSVVLGANVEPEVQKVENFRRGEAPLGVRVEAVEVRASSIGQVGVVGLQLPQDIDRFMEVPPEGPYGHLIEAIQSVGAMPKLRTGGTDPETFPLPDQVIQFLIAVTLRRAPFKATAGLHHPYTGDYPLTYEAGSANFRMYGFINLLLAAVELESTRDAETAQELLEDTDDTAFRRDSVGWWWRNHRYSNASVASGRALFRSFGSCSFHEPVADLQRQGLL